MLLSHGIPRHVDGLDGPERKKSCTDGVFLEFKGNAADVNSEKKVEIDQKKVQSSAGLLTEF